MSVRLTVKMRGSEGDKAQVVILTDELIVLGRDEKCQVVLAQQAVSRNHARISRDGPLFFLEDLGSSYGTMVNGDRLPKGEKRLLRNGDTIAIAQFDLVFDRVAEEAAVGTTNLLSKKLVKDIMRGLTNNIEQPYFRLMNGAKEGQRIPLNEGQELVFGRDETCNVVLQDDLVSRRHAKVRRDISGIHVEDLASRNGIRVNKKKVKKQTLRDRDELEIGVLRLLFLDPTEVREGPVVMPSVHDGDEDERTTSLPPATDEALSEEQAEEEASESPEEVAGSTEAEDGAQEEEAPEASFSDAAPEGAGEEDGEGAGDENADENQPASGIDLKQRRTQVMLGIVGVTLAIGLVLLIAILAGA